MRFFPPLEKASNNWIGKVISIRQLKESEDPTIAYLALHLLALDDEFEKLRAICGGLQTRNQYLTNVLERFKPHLQRLRSNLSAPDSQNPPAV